MSDIKEYEVYGVGSFTTPTIKVEAESAEQAVEKSYSLIAPCICHECTREIEVDGTDYHVAYGVYDHEDSYRDKRDPTKKLTAEADKLKAENERLRNMLEDVSNKSIDCANELASYIKAVNEGLKKAIIATDLDEPEYHDYQTPAEAGQAANKALEYLTNNQ